MTYEKANELQTQTVAAELAGDFKKAYELQNELATLLPPLIANGVKCSKELMRAKLQQQVVTERLAALGSFVVGGEGEPPKPLPSTATLTKEIEDPPAGTCFLSLVEAGSTSVMQVRAGLPDQPDPNQLGTTFLTPLLAASLPDTTYFIYAEIFSGIYGGWANCHAKDENKNTHYTVTGHKLHGYQLPRAVFARASEYSKDIAIIDMAPINPKKYTEQWAHLVGRTMTILWGPTGTTTQVIPDRQDRINSTYGFLPTSSWAPRRFTWGGKRFVWKGLKDAAFEEEKLYEVKKEWPDPKSKTGKIADETHERPLVIAKKIVMGQRMGTFTVVGGLDQNFREFLIATYLAKVMVERSSYHHI
ncbi:hypothetical protein CPB86DRAFT_790772 [Serendipita vermifera]|nr:hypothetical protein CPB86DRAFT_790772 [Serendipita vermifera]